MNFIVYVNHWSNDLGGTDAFISGLEKQLEKSGYDYKILNSSDKIYEGKDWINLGWLWYNKTIHYAMKDFVQHDYDYFGFLCADITSTDWQKTLDRADEVLNKYKPASLSFYERNPIYTIKNTSVRKLESDSNLYESLTQDGTFIFYEKDIVVDMLNFFDYVESRSDNIILRTGWGLDTLFSALCHIKNKVMLKDKSYIVNNSIKTSFSIHGFETQKKEYDYLVNCFIDYCEEQNIDCYDLIKKIWSCTWALFNHEYPFKEKR